MRARALVRELAAGAVVLDAGCGTGAHLADLLPPSGGTVIGTDLSAGMLKFARIGGARQVRLVQSDLRSLPFVAGAFDAVFARNSLVHTDSCEVPLLLAGWHRAMAAEARLAASFAVARGASERFSVVDDDMGDRTFIGWEEERLHDVVVGAGFEDVVVEPSDGFVHWVSARRGRTLPDVVGAGMRLLVCGLNPSLRAADAGVGFVTAGNRFWPAALATGLVTTDRSPVAALGDHGIGFTDIVKRATPRADALRACEYRAGLARIERLVRWLQPGAIVFVGLAGWRAAVDRRAVAGVQPQDLGGVPVYVMPSTSGLNAATPLSALADHLAAATDLADAVRPPTARGP